MIPAFMRNFTLPPAIWATKYSKQNMPRSAYLICWDQWYPEAARITALMGAEILFYPTAIGWATSQDDATNTEQYNAWQTIQRSHAVANGVHVVSVNRVGQEARIEILGRIILCQSVWKHHSPGIAYDEEVIVQEIDLSKTDHYRTHWPFLRDRRIDSYQPITKSLIDED